MQTEYKNCLEEFKVDFAAWRKKYNVSDEDVKRKSKNKKKDQNEDDEKKPTKTKGTK